uniref:Retinol dehydrogenase 14 n=2 Tax=Plectus sambesii TaxID=2011161 RepID=A0A914V5A4_9BILA
MEHGYSSSRAYNCSKLANVLFTKHLARQLSHTKITVNCLHPGSVATDLFRSVSPWMQPLIPIFSLWFKTVEEGADSILHLAAAPELDTVTGKYFWDCKPAMTSRQANDAVAAEKFWKISEELTGYKSPTKKQ